MKFPKLYKKTPKVSAKPPEEEEEDAETSREESNSPPADDPIHLTDADQDDVPDLSTAPMPAAPRCSVSIKVQEADEETITSDADTFSDTISVSSAISRASSPRGLRGGVGRRESVVTMGVDAPVAVKCVVTPSGEEMARSRGASGRLGAPGAKGGRSMSVCTGSLQFQ